MDVSKLLRKTIKDTTWVDMQHVDYVVSPDKKYKIAFSHFQEIRMSTYEGLFTLLDDNDTIIEKFEPLTAISNGLCCWTRDSNYFAVAVGHSPSGYLIVRLPEIDFAFIKMVNPYLHISFNGDKFFVGYSDEQVALANSTQTFGGGILEIPTKTMIKPNELTFDLLDLSFIQENNLTTLQTLLNPVKNIIFN